MQRPSNSSPSLAAESCGQAMFDLKKETLALEMGQVKLVAVASGRAKAEKQSKVHQGTAGPWQRTGAPTTKALVLTRTVDRPGTPHAP
ncbi:hypothetical protein MHYP_G00016420 [Metynnis hypsauchen]